MFMKKSLFGLACNGNSEVIFARLIKSCIFAHLKLCFINSDNDYVKDFLDHLFSIEKSCCDTVFSALGGNQ